MEKHNKYFFIVGLTILLICSATIGFCFRNKETNRSVGGYTETARGVNNELKGEQQTALTGTTEAINSAFIIGRISEKTNSTIEQLGGLDRRSSDIYTQIRAECDILENYLNSISSIIDDYNSNNKDK